MSIKRVRRNTLQNLRGQVTFVVKVTDEIRGISVLEDATASSNNVKDDLNNIKKRAIANAVYKYVSRGIGAYQLDNNNNFVDNKGRFVNSGTVSSSVFGEIVRIKAIKYELTNNTRLKRENWNGTYMSVVRDNKGRIVRRTKWSNK